MKKQDDGYSNPNDVTGVVVEDWNEKGLYVPLYGDFVIVQLPDALTSFRAFGPPEAITITANGNDFVIATKIVPAVENTQINATVIGRNVLFKYHHGLKRPLSIWMMTNSASCLATFVNEGRFYYKYVLKPDAALS